MEKKILFPPVRKTTKSSGCETNCGPGRKLSPKLVEATLTSLEKVVVDVLSESATGVAREEHPSGVLRLYRFSGQGGKAISPTRLAERYGDLLCTTGRTSRFRRHERGAGRQSASGDVAGATTAAGAAGASSAFSTDATATGLNGASAAT